MPLVLETKQVKDLTPKEVKRCMKLTFDGERGTPIGYSGELGWRLRLACEDPSDRDRAYLAKENNVVVGWALGFYSGDRWTVQLYVLPAYRRRGIGTKLIGRAKQGRSYPIAVAAHNHAASEFFSAGIERGALKDYWR